MKQSASSTRPDMKSARAWNQGDVVEVCVERAALGGKLIAHAPDGRVTWLNSAHALGIGDRVSGHIHSLSKKSVTLNVTTIHETSDDRSLPFCPHLTQCGGCPWQGLTQAQQLEALQRDIDRLLSRATGAPLPWSTAWSEDDRRWRHTARLHSRGHCQLGFFGPSGLLHLEHCPVFIPTLDKILSELQAKLSPLLTGEAEVKISAAPHETSGTVSVQLFGFWPPLHLDKIKEVLEALCSDEGSVHGATLEAHSPHLLRSSQQPEIQDTHPLHRSGAQRRGRQRAHDRGRKTARAKPRRERHTRPISKHFDEAHCTPIDLSWGTPYNHLSTPHPAGAFMQAHQSGNFALIQQVLEGIGEATDILELYAGSGNFTVPLARSKEGRRVTALEFDIRAVSALNRYADAECLGITALAQQINQLPIGRFDHILLDPPRAGAAPIIDALAQSQAEAITYISCHPAALARDLTVLTHGGWKVQNARIFHLFPHSGHAEVYCLLARG